MDRGIRTVLISLSAVLLFAGVCAGSALAYTLPVAPGDLYEGACPVCGGHEATIADLIDQPTCTSGVTVWVYCHTIEGSVGTGAIPALGHSYVETTTAVATCTEAGSSTYTCSRCGDAYTQTLPALGHNYVSKTVTEASCEEEGLIRYTCTRCGRSYDRSVEAFGHEVEYEEKEASCLEDGYKKGVCARCGEEFIETFPALGHDLGPFTVTMDASCTADGLREAVCKRCGNIVSETIAAVGHQYSEEWILEKEPTVFAEGLQVKICSVCGDRIEQTIPRKSIVPLILILSGILAAAALLWVLFGRLRLFRKFLRAFRRPTIEKRSLVIASGDEELISALKKKRFLKVTGCAKEELEKTVEEEQPDLIIRTVLCEKDLPEGREPGEQADNGGEEPALGVLVSSEVLGACKGRLDDLKESGTVTGYALMGSAPGAVLIRLVLPVLKPTFKSDDTLENIGLLAEVLGFPAAARAVEVYTAGREVREILKEDETGAEEAATVISDIAGILGFDTVASVADLLGNLNDVRAALRKGSGAYEKAEGAGAATKIAGTIRDLADL